MFRSDPRQQPRQLGPEIVQDMLQLPHGYGDMREWPNNEFGITDGASAALPVMPFSESAIER